jgi:putative hydrolase of the HAD superfamily
LEIIKSIDFLVGLDYKHISFDLWLTLIKSNPNYKSKRNQLFKEFFEIGYDIELVSQKVRYYDVVCNSINEKTGKNIDTNEIYLLILSSLGYDVNKLNKKMLDEFYKETEKIFFENEPVLINSNTHQILNDLRNEGITMNVLSNTGFIKGSTLRFFLDKNNLGNYFDFQIYSDECNYSKPNVEIFKLVYDRITIKNRSPKSQVLHIGDNLIADCDGAKAFGFSSFHFKN